jgi:flagellar biosynthesis/type III secretory pathway M-ring protein FliF/YscJ
MLTCISLAFGYNPYTWFNWEFKVFMARILILIILGWILYQIIKRIVANANTKSTQADVEAKPEQKIVQCAHCGCHVPESESQLKDDKIICNNPDCIKNESAKK